MKCQLKNYGFCDQSKKNVHQCQCIWHNEIIHSSFSEVQMLTDLSIKHSDHMHCQSTEVYQLKSQLLQVLNAPIIKQKSSKKNLHRLKVSGSSFSSSPCGKKHASLTELTRDTKVCSDTVDCRFVRHAGWVPHQKSPANLQCQ